MQAAENSFQLVALEWYAKFSTKWVASHGDRTLRRLEKDVFPWIGNRPICEIKAPELLTVLRRIENRGAIETAHRIHQICEQVFRYAIATGKAERDISSDLRGALPPTRKRHHATIVEPKKIAELLKAIQSYEGYFVTKCALQLAPLFFVRPGELRKAEWSEFNFETAEWRIPAEKMKMRATHIVLLCAQAISILRELETLTGNSQYVFPSIRTLRRPMSDNTVLGALRRLGYSKDEMTGHGFRSMASTLLNEQGWNRDAIERQLAHAERNNIRAAYNYAEYLPERRKMMQHWADYLDTLTNSSVIKPFVAA
jgi:integrase